ncbi:MAG: hypothetical protein QXF10_08780 [Ignisphaera sp.]
MDRAIHLILFAVASISIGSASIFVRISNASPIACAFWRLSIASIILALLPTGKERYWQDWPTILRMWRRGFKVTPVSRTSDHTYLTYSMQFAKPHNKKSCNKQCINLL